MKFVATITIDDVLSALGAFLQPFIGPTQIVRGLVNRVPPPPGAYVQLTELLQTDLETPTVTSDTANSQVNVLGPKQIDVQVDFYGPSAGDQCSAVKGIFRAGFAAQMFPDGIRPLYCSDGTQSPLITGEEQYESRWIITASLQYNPVVSIPQQSALTLAVNTLEVLS